MALLFGLFSALYIASHEVQAINSVLDINGTFPYLIDKQTGDIIEPRDYMDFESIYAPNETYKLSQTAQGRNYHLIKAFDFANYYQSDYWHYSNKDDLIKSAQPVASASKCSNHLNWIERHLNRTDDVLFQRGEQHINLMALMDSYGHPEAGTYFGHGYWLGSYYECSRVNINRARFDYEDCLNSGKTAEECSRVNRSTHEDNTYDTSMKFRYCIGKGHESDWPSAEQDNYVPRISYKIGLCLPETCETLSFGSHSQQLERLMRFNLPKYMRKRINLHDIYCLPDRRSPIRQLPLSGRIYLGVLGAWMVLMLVSTFIYSCYKRHQRDIREIMQASLAAQIQIQNHHHHHLHQQQHHELLDHHASNHILPTSLTMMPEKSASLNWTNGLVVDTSKTFDNEEPIKTSLSADEQNQVNSAKLLLKIQLDNSPNRSTTNNATTIIYDHNPLSSAAMKTTTAAVAATNANGKNQKTTVSDSDLSTSSSNTSSTLSAWIYESPTIVKILQALSIKETMKEFRQPPKMLETPEARRKLRVNLNALDFIKCLCCILVIFGHIIFIHMQHLSNIIHTIELSYEIYTRPLIAFFNFVDTFFIISGMLTAYFIFKRFNKRTFSNPVIWFSVSLLRLVRLSPVYILVFWFIKTISVYIADGPVWDYGTDKNSIKGLCINDNWWKSILYLGNVGTMQPHCILPAWSIIVDSQYSLFIPIIMFLIFKHKRVGYAFLLVATLISTTKMSLQLASQTAVKTSDMAKIRLHVYPLISRFAAEFYNTAWNRMGPVAIGIFGGHMLYLYEIGHIKQWPRFMHGVCFKIVLALHVLIFMLPVIGRYTDDPSQTSETDNFIFIMSNATIKPIWSVINTIFLLRLITDLSKHSVLARLASHNVWHCLGKLCFTSYLIHYEIILTLLKSRQDGLVDPNWMNAMREFSAVFLISTVISYFVYILYEAPVNRLIMLIFAAQNEALKNRDFSNNGSARDNNDGDGNDDDQDDNHYSTVGTKDHHHHRGDHKMETGTNYKYSTNCSRMLHSPTSEQLLKKQQPQSQQQQFCHLSSTNLSSTRHINSSSGSSSNNNNNDNLNNIRRLTMSTECGLAK